MVIVINNQGIVKKASRGRSRSPAITTIFAIYRGRSFKCLYDRKVFFRSRLNISLEIQWLIQVPLTKVGELCSIQPATLFNSLLLLLLFYTPWKHKKTFRFSDVFRGYRKATPGYNGLIKDFRACVGNSWPYLLSSETEKRNKKLISLRNSFWVN